MKGKLCCCLLMLAILAVPAYATNTATLQGGVQILENLPDGASTEGTPPEFDPVQEPDYCVNIRVPVCGEGCLSVSACSMWEKPEVCGECLGEEYSYQACVDDRNDTGVCQ